MLTTRTTRSAPGSPLPLPEAVAKPALLVSVRDPAEALAALEGGAQVIDVKEPSRGPLGAADTATLEAIVRAVAGRAPVTAACGEMHEQNGPPAAVEGIVALKVGLAKASLDWAEKLALWREGLPSATHVVPAAYWDHSAAEAPAPEAVLALAAGLDRWMVLDTWDKSGDPLPVEDPCLARLMRDARKAGVRIALAGGLTRESLSGASRLGATLVGVRGAACVGGRKGQVDSSRVRDLSQTIARTRLNGLP